MTEEFWYRYEDIQYSAGVNEYDDPLPGPGELRVHLRRYEMMKHTPKGVWLNTYGWATGAQRFVLKDARKQFACPTIEEAKASFIARKKRQAAIYRARLKRAEKALAIIEGRDVLALCA